MRHNRREFLKFSGSAGSLVALGGCATRLGAKPQVVVIGAGFGGAAAAKYLMRWSAGTVDVILIERNAQFISCPMSNLVIAGEKQLSDLTHDLATLQAQGIRVVHDEAQAIDAERRLVKLGRGDVVHYDRLIVSPGIDFLYDTIPGLKDASAQQRVLHAWKAGEQTLVLRQQLRDMRDGGVYAITVPRAPYRCPPGPYERASLIAAYFKQHKPTSKVLILDANEEVVSKKALFMKFWADHYAGMLEYRPQSELRDVDAASRTAILDFDEVKADVLNVVPPQRAGDIALRAGLVNLNQRWCGVDWLSMESTAAKNIHVLGDAIFPGPAMPKSAHMANQHAKLAAAAIIDLLADRPPNPEPVVMNTCYSYVDTRNAIHVSSVHQYDAAEADKAKSMKPVPGAGGVSAAPSEREAEYAQAWAHNIWADTLE